MQDRQREQQERADSEEVDYAFKLAALYITLAFALQPKRDVYKRSLKAGNQLSWHGPGPGCHSASMSLWT